MSDQLFPRRHAVYTKITFWDVTQKLLVVERKIKKKRWKARKSGHFELKNEEKFFRFF